MWKILNQSKSKIFLLEIEDKKALPQKKQFLNIKLDPSLKKGMSIGLLGLMVKYINNFICHYKELIFLFPPAGAGWPAWGR